jgi:hypothetical protein
MIDFFGYDKTVLANNQIITAQFAAVSANGQMSLVQNVQMNYSRQIQPMFEAGSSTLYYLQGNSEGQLSINSAVGKKGFFANFRNVAQNCGQINQVSIDLLAGGNCSVGTSGGLTFSGALAEGFSVAYTAGPMAVTEGAQIRIASMNVR